MVAFVTVTVDSPVGADHHLATLCLPVARRLDLQNVLSWHSATPSTLHLKLYVGLCLACGIQQKRENLCAEDGGRR